MSKLVAVVIVVGIVAASGAYGRWPINSIEDVLDYLPEKEQISTRVHEALTYLDRGIPQNEQLTTERIYNFGGICSTLVNRACDDDIAYYLIPIFIRNDFPRFRNFLMSHWKQKLKESAVYDATVIGSWRRPSETFNRLDKFFRAALVGSTSRRHDEDYFRKLTQLDLTTSQLKVNEMLEVVKEHADVMDIQVRYSWDPMVQIEAFLRYLCERSIGPFESRYALVNLDHFVSLVNGETMQQHNREFEILNEIYRACSPVRDEQKRANIMRNIRLQYVAQPAVVKKKKSWWSAGSSS